MKLISIALDSDEMPEKVVAELTLDEMIWIGRVTGRQSPSSSEELVPGYGLSSQTLYYCAIGSLFNRFWDDGIDGAIRGESE